MSISPWRGCIVINGETTVGPHTYRVHTFCELPDDANIEEYKVTHDNGLVHLSVPKRRSARAAAEKKHMATPEANTATDSMPGGSSAREDVVPPTLESPPVLTECKADAANIQRPEEKTQAILMEPPTSPPPPPPSPPSGEAEKSPLYLAGYQRALEDMKIERSESTDTEDELSCAGHLLTAERNEMAASASDTLTATGESAVEGSIDEWDIILDDLAEMGFDNGELNRKALAKHSGSINLAIKELVASRIQGVSVRAVKRASEE